VGQFWRLRFVAFRSEQFACARPFLYHLTFRANLPRVRATSTLETAAEIASAAGQLNLVRARRAKHVPLTLRDGGRVYLRDQTPLHEKNIELLDGWTLADLVEHLNRRVYFWPGTEHGPISYGRRHFERYRTEQPAILRVDFSSLVSANPEREPLFCLYNSGSPRYSGGRASPRGPNTFVPAEAFPKGPPDVVEVTFAGSLKLPSNVQVADGPDGEWVPLLQ
jgi:hypothetical protein